MLTILVSPEMICTIQRKIQGKNTLISTLILPQSFALVINKPISSSLMKRSTLESFGAQRLVPDKTALPSDTIIVCNISTQDNEIYYFYPASMSLNEVIQNFNQLIKNFSLTQNDLYTISPEKKHCFLQKLITFYTAKDNDQHDFTFYSFTVDSIKEITAHKDTSSIFKHDDSLQFQFFGHPSRNDESVHKDITQSTITPYKITAISPMQGKQTSYGDNPKPHATTYTKPYKYRPTLFSEDSKESGPERNGLSCWFGWVENTESVASISDQSLTYGTQ